MAFTMDVARGAGYPRRTHTDPFIGGCSLRITLPAVAAKIQFPCFTHPRSNETRCRSPRRCLPDTETGRILPDCETRIHPLHGRTG